VLFGVWVIAHECGHGAFSEHPRLNDALGLLLHSALLASYFSWKYSHLRHHANTGSLDRDEVYVPRRKADLPPYTERFYGAEDHPGARLALLAVQLTVGWPMYLAFNTWGRAFEFLSPLGLSFVILVHERGIPCKCESLACVECVPAPCTHRPSLLPMKWLARTMDG